MSSVGLQSGQSVGRAARLGTAALGGWVTLWQRTAGNRAPPPAVPHCCLPVSHCGSPCHPGCPPFAALPTLLPTFADLIALLLHLFVCSVTIGMELVTDPSILVLVSSRLLSLSATSPGPTLGLVLPAAVRACLAGRLLLSIALLPVNYRSSLLQDEPTSGLDSYTADMLMASLKTVAGAGRVVLASLHQPSRCALLASETACEAAAAQRRLPGGAARVRLPDCELHAPTSLQCQIPARLPPRRDVFYSLDQVVLMGHGRMLYMGPPSEGEPLLAADSSHFSQRGCLLELPWFPAQPSHRLLGAPSPERCPPLVFPDCCSPLPSCLPCSRGLV